MFLARKKKKTDLETLLKNKLNQRIRTTQILIHKVGLLWWLVYGFHLNKLANDAEILATCLSLISKNDYPKGRVDLVYLQRVTMWIKKTFPLDPNRQQKVLTTESLLERIREKKKISDYRELVLIYIALLRAIGLNCRLVVSLSPPSLKPKREQLFQTKKEENPKKELKEEKSEDQKKKSTKKSKSKKKENKIEPMKIIAENSQDGRKKAQTQARKKAAAILKEEKFEEKTKSEIMKDTILKNDSKSKSLSKSQGDSKTQIVSATKSSSSKASEKEKSRKKESEKTLTIATKLRKRIANPPVREPLLSTEIDDEEESDEDFVFRKPTRRVKNEKVLKNNRKLISESEEEEEKKKSPEDIWVEVYVESEESWISVSITTGKIHCVNEIYVS